MKTISWCLLIIFIAGLSGCAKEPDKINPDSGYIYIGVEPNSSQIYVMALMPGINSMYERTEELTSQNEWLRRNLNKCLEKLEIERELKSIQMKYPLPLRGDPNLASQFSEIPEPWFVPYESSAIEPLSDKPDNIKMLIALMGMHSASMSHYISYTDEWIDNFEERMKRLENQLEK